MIIIGQKEVDENVISIRNRDTLETVSMPLDDFIKKITLEIAERGLSPVKRYGKRIWTR